jgi:hypothetical protein
MRTPVALIRCLVGLALLCPAPSAWAHPNDNVNGNTDFPFDFEVN